MKANLYTSLRNCTFLLMLLFPYSHLQADDFDDLLQAFNQRTNVKTANTYFNYLLKEEMLESPVVFKADTPTDTLCAQVWYWAGEWYYAQAEYQQACDYLLKALPLLQNGKDQTTEADCLNLLAVAYVRLSDYNHALKYAKLCYAIDKASGDPDVISSSLNTLTGIYLGAGQPQEAENYVLKGIKMAKQANNPGRLAILQGMASEVYHALGNDQEALKYVDQAYELELKLGRTDKAMVRLTQKASVLIGLHQYLNAEDVLQDAIPFFRNNGDRHSLGISLNKMGMTLFSQQREAEAVPYYREAAEIFQSMGDIYNEVHARKGLYESLWESDPEEAKQHLDRFNTLKDSIYNNTSAESLARYNAEFGNDWLQLENHAERTAKQQAIIAGICVTAILLLLSFGIWWVMRRRHRQQEKINQELSEHIEALREQYRQLNVHYDNAMMTHTSPDEDKDLTASDREFLEKSINIINELIYTGQIDAATVADKMGMSLFQYRQRLTSITDETPQTFIQMLRMRRARHLLDNHHELNISEIATLCAYNDTPNFTRAFKKAFGMTPSQYLSNRHPNNSNT
ncbi:MAG: tetratricopeptide repeat protein [Bacteroidaceae bacterium]|nr:tetratricopeptide repeat protein [Bacteroidaceae bacterium]